MYTGNSLNEKEKNQYESTNPDDIPYVSSKDINVERFTVNYNNGLRIPRENNPLKVSTNGSFLMVIEGGSSGKKIVYLNEDVCFVNKLCSFNSGENTKYQYYFVQSKNYQDRFKSSLSGLIGGVSVNVLRNFYFPLPPLSEQKQISGYLDRKTQQIDDLIEKMERKIKLLTEQKTSLINQYVTKGLNANVEMKDSGIEWIGDIPKHWNLSKAKWVTEKIGSGVTPKGGGEVYSEEGIPFLRSQNIHFDGLHLKEVVYISEEIDNSMSGSRIRQNDVLYNITGGSIGRCCLVETDDRMNVNQHVCIVRPSQQIDPYYLLSILSSEFGQRQLRSNLTGSGREGLNFKNLGNFVIPMMEVSEQVLIGLKISELTITSYNLEDKLIQKIQKLKEYRESLISSAVTGKVRVTEDMI